MASPESLASKSAHSASSYGIRQWCGLIMGPLLLMCTLFFDPPSGLSVEGWKTAGITCLMATFWICETIPIPVTALLPLALFPLLGISNAHQTAMPYANPIIYLFFGGFVLAMAMQKWNLHKRVALHLITWVGTSPARVVAGFLIASACISMWCSNTATAMMLLPIAMSVTVLLQANNVPRGVCSVLLLAIAYGSTTGGMGTLIGTPPNALFAATVNDMYGIEIGFAQWMLIGVPMVLITLPIVYLTLVRVVYRVDNREVPGLREMIQEQKQGLGKMSRGEKLVALVFIGTALGWVFQSMLSEWVPMLTDTTVAMTAAIILFLLPISLRKGEFVMDWETAKKLPWGVLILFGGGLSLASNIQGHGLSAYLGTLCSGIDGISIWIIVAVVSFGILMLTELTSNTATAATFLPVVAAIAVSMGENPLLLMIPAALAANCSYMLPVGTPPNAIVFGSGMITLPEMARAGLMLNIVLVPVMVVLVWLLGPLVFGIELGTLPEWVSALTQ